MSSGKKHSKKRNVGLVYQFLVRHVTEATLRADSATAQKATAILKEHFRHGTELYREWRLFNAVIKTRGLNDTAATAVLRETRNAAVKVDVKKLDDEKLRLIDVITRDLGQTTFEHNIPSYRTYATIQTLFNDWRSTSPDVVRIVDYESKLREHLTTSEQRQQKHVGSRADDALIVKLMTEKFNERYVSKLHPRQRVIITTYTTEGVSSRLITLLDDVKRDALSTMRRYVTMCNDKHMISKLNDAQQIVETFDVSKDVDQAVTRCMKLCELIDELKT